MIHPITAHFAVALPVVALLLALIYLFKREELFSRASTQVLVLGAIAMIAAWYTGGEEGPEVFMALSEEGQALLKEHKAFGLYTMIAVVAAAVVKFVGCMRKQFAVEAVAIVVLIAGVAMTFYQGSMGGDLVYKHGAGVEQHARALECVNNPCEYIEFEEINCNELGTEEE